MLCYEIHRTRMAQATNLTKMHIENNGLGGDVNRTNNIVNVIWREIQFDTDLNHLMVDRNTGIVSAFPTKSNHIADICANFVDF